MLLWEHFNWTEVYSPVNQSSHVELDSLSNFSWAGLVLSAVNQYFCILSPETDNCPSWSSARERMTVENISWSISLEEYCRTRRGLNPRPPDHQSDAHPNEPLRPASGSEFFPFNPFSTGFKYQWSRFLLAKVAPLWKIAANPFPSSTLFALYTRAKIISGQGGTPIPLYRYKGEVPDIALDKGIPEKKYIFLFQFIKFFLVS